MISPQDRANSPRGQFELMKGCVIGDIVEIDAPTKQIKKKVRKTALRQHGTFFFLNAGEHPGVRAKKSKR